jgi:hypothetical protein
MSVRPVMRTFGRFCATLCRSMREIGAFFACAVLSCAFAACGDGGGGGGATASVRTLAYALSECREDATQSSFRQELRIQRDEGAPVTVTDVTEAFVQEPPVFPGACRLTGESRNGLAAVFAGGIRTKFGMAGKQQAERSRAGRGAGDGPQGDLGHVEIEDASDRSTVCKGSVITCA